MAPTLIIGVVSVVAAVAVGFAFKELIYEPFIAPIVEDWQEEFGPRRRRYPNEPYSASTDYYYDDTVPLRRSGPSVELDSLAAGEMREWRGSMRVTDPTNVRHRRPGVDTTIPATSGFEPMRSSHVIFDSSAGPSTATQSPYLTPTRSGTPAMPDSPPVVPKKDQPPPVHARGLSQASSIRAASRPAAIQAELGRGNEIGAFQMSPEIPTAQLGRPNVPVSPASSSFSPSGSAYGAASRSAFASPVLRTTGVPPPTVKFQQPTPISPTAPSPRVMHRRVPSEQRSQGTTSPTSPTMFASALQWQADVAAHEPLSSPSILPSEIGSPVIIPRPNIEATGPRSPTRATHGRSSLGLAQPPRVTSPFSDAMSIGTEHWSDMEGHTSAQPPRVTSPVESHHSMQIIDHPAIMDDHVSVRSHASTGSHVDPRSPDVGVTALSDEDDDDLSVVSHGTGWESISSAGRVAANGRPNMRPTSS